ncbi:hypothetical protein [Streptomyces diastatochromogenes]|uniref:hypothetical protein n=1 Tax=Streptomyces diastatochromogenes TaxID=42236 RepID=UPI0036CF88DE
MVNYEFLQIAAPLAIPVITGVVGGIGLIFKDYRHSKSAERKASQQLRHATAQLQFISDWVQTRQLLGSASDAHGALELMERSLVSVAQQGIAVREKRQPVSLRRILLLVPLKSFTAQFARLLFWLSLFIVPLFGVTGALDVITGATDESAFTVSDTAFTTLFFGGLGLAFRVWARAADSRFRRKHAVAP